MEEIRFESTLFGGKIEICLYDAEEMVSSGILEGAYEEALRLQAIFNFYDRNSELSRLNSSREAIVSEELLYVLSYALDMCEKTDGAYDISLGRQFLQRKSWKEIEKVDCSFKDIRIIGKKVTLGHPDVLLDLGSIAKGYIADRIADYLKSYGVEEFMIDARGDMVFSGNSEHIIGIAHPRKSTSIRTIKIRNCAVATSGDYNQYHGSYENSHILNSKDIISVTVIAKELMVADAYATALFVCSNNSIDNILINQDISAFLVDKDLRVAFYNDFRRFLAGDAR